MTSVWGSSTSSRVISPTARSLSLPTEIIRENPRPRAWPRESTVPSIVPLWDTNATRPQIYLRKHGYRGALYPVNPGRSEVLGEPAFARVEAIPGPVDHALIMVPAEGVLAALEGCARKGISVVTVYSDGFTEAGPEGQAMQQALVARARELGVRLLGPNSIGMINVAGQVPLSVNAALACDTLTAGRVAFCLLYTSPSPRD